MIPIPECPDSARFEDETCVFERFPGPTHRERAQNMTMRHDKDVSPGLFALQTRAVVFLPDLCNQRVQPTDDVFRGSAYVSAFLSNATTFSTIFCPKPS